MLPGRLRKVALAEVKHVPVPGKPVSTNNTTMVMKITNMKETILAFLQDAELTVNQVAEKAGIDANNARVYVNRLKVEGKIREISKEGKAKVYTGNVIAAPVSDPMILSHLKFLNEFFKANAEYLLADETIKEFILNHQEFDEVEKLCQA